MHSFFRLTLPAVGAIALGLAAFNGAAAADSADFSVTIKDHLFEPADIRVPAGQTIRLTVRNEDATPEEFESHDLNREKIIPGGASVVIEFGPLKPGTYEFVGEFNEDSAKGRIVAE